MNRCLSTASAIGLFRKSGFSIACTPERHRIIADQMLGIIALHIYIYKKPEVIAIQPGHQDPETSQLLPNDHLLNNICVPERAKTEEEKPSVLAFGHLKIHDKLELSS